MKILYFNYLYDLFGISIGSTIKAIELMGELQNCGHEVKICWRKEQSSNKNSFSSNSRALLKKHLARYLHEPNQVLSNFRNLLEENRIISNEAPDLIISRLDVCLFSGLLLAKMKRIPLLLEIDSPEVYEFSTFHGEYITHQKLLKYVELLNIKYANACFTVSNDLKHYFLQQGMPEEKIHVITNGADVTRFIPRINKQKVVGKYALQNKIVVGFVGSFHYWHGVENLISLIEGTLALQPNICFLLVGEGGPMKTKLEQFITKKGHRDRVILTGHIVHEEIPQYISTMDIVLAPYPKLDFFYYSPVKIYEYMACGKPVVTTRIGQIAEIIQDGKNGFLCRPDDVKQMQAKISELVTSPSLRALIGEAATQTMVEHHSWREKAEQLSRLCQQVLDNHRNGTK